MEGEKVVKNGEQRETTTRSDTVGRELLSQGEEREEEEEEEKEEKGLTVVVSGPHSVGSSRKSSSTSDTSGSSIDTHTGYLTYHYDSSGFHSDTSDYKTYKPGFQPHSITRIPEETNSQESLRLSGSSITHVSSPGHTTNLSTLTETCV